MLHDGASLITHRGEHKNDNNPQKVQSALDATKAYLEAFKNELVHDVGAEKAAEILEEMNKLPESGPTAPSNGSSNSSGPDDKPFMKQPYER